MLTNEQIQEFTRRAKLAGLTDEQIQQEIERKVKELSGVTSPVAQAQQPQNIANTRNANTTQPSTTQQVSTNLGESSGSGIGSFVVNFIKGLVQPAVDYTKFVGEAAYQGSKFVFDPVFRKAVLGEKLTPEEEKKLASEKPTLFYSEEEAQRKLGDTGKIALTGVKATAGAESYFIPFGRGTNIATKVFIPGAVSAGLFEASQENATPESIAEAAVSGAATAGVLEGVGGMLSWFKDKSGNLIRQSEKVAEGTRKIKVKPSVYGASEERAINETLNKYGFSGSAQKQYEKLAPTLDDIENKIQSVIKENPDVKISIDDIRNSFMDNLQSSLRTKDITNKQAINEINGYLNDLLLAARREAGEEVSQALVKGNQLPKEISLGTLRDMKRILNQDYGGVFKKLQNGTPLNPREKVIAAAWNSLDEAVRNASPELKQLLVDESNLYKAAQPLSAARFNPPTLRGWGTSIPSFVTQKIRDVTQSGLRVLGLGAEKIPEGGIPGKQALEKAGAFGAAILSNQKETEEMSQLEDTTPTTTPTTPVEEQILQKQVTPSPLNPFGGLSKRQVLALALSSGASAKDLDEIGKIYDMIAADSSAVSEENMKIANDLRTEYFKRTQENGWIDIVNAYNKVVNTSDTAAGDVSLLYAFMKLLDPGSVVREGEFATAENTAGIPQKIRQQYNKALKGDRLSPEQRAAFKQEALRVFQVHQQRQAPIDAYYQGLAQRYGIDPSLIGVGLYR